MRRLQGLNGLWIALALSLLSACGPGASGGIEVRDAIVQVAGAQSGMSLPGGNAAGYLTVRNTGSSDDRLLAVSADIAEAVELHMTEMQGDVMTMKPVHAIDVPAGDEVQFGPGGLHIMFIRLTRELSVGDKVTLGLEFEKAGEMTVQAEVRAP
jgi:copper(I)-binding protein